MAVISSNSKDNVIDACIKIIKWFVSCLLNMLCRDQDIAILINLIDNFTKNHAENKLNN